jgi:FKBP-type peptidyl-prolyl cis-trans isomerase
MGVKAGGYRKVRVSPHLAYRDKGIPDLIPSDAVLICEVWLRNIVRSSSVESLPGVT